MTNINRLCHSLGSLEAQIAALNANIVQLQASLLSLNKRVGALERKSAFWQGKFAALLGILAFIGCVMNLAFQIK